MTPLERTAELSFDVKNEYSQPINCSDLSIIVRPEAYWYMDESDPCHYYTTYAYLLHYNFSLTYQKQELSGKGFVQFQDHKIEYLKFSMNDQKNVTEKDVEIKSPDFVEGRDYDSLHP